MIKAIFTALTGIDESIDSPESQEAWEKQKVIDEEDLEEEEVDQDADSQLLINHCGDGLNAGIRLYCWLLLS